MTYSRIDSLLDLCKNKFGVCYVLAFDSLLPIVLVLVFESAHSARNAMYCRNDCWSQTVRSQRSQIEYEYRFAEYEYEYEQEPGVACLAAGPFVVATSSLPANRIIFAFFHEPWPGAETFLAIFVRVSRLKAYPAVPPENSAE